MSQVPDPAANAPCAWRSVSRPVPPSWQLAGRLDEADDDLVITLTTPQPADPRVGRGSRRRVRPGAGRYPRLARDVVVTPAGVHLVGTPVADHPDRTVGLDLIVTVATADDVVAGSGADPVSTGAPDGAVVVLGQPQLHGARGPAIGSVADSPARGHVHAYATRGARPAEDVGASASRVRSPVVRAAVQAVVSRHPRRARRPACRLPVRPVGRRRRSRSRPPYRRSLPSPPQSRSLP